MDNLIPFTLDDGNVVLIQVDPTDDGPYRQVSRDGDNDLVSRTSHKLATAIEPIRSTAESILNAFKNFSSQPDEVSIELSVKITSEANVIITKGSIEGNFKITVKWQHKDHG